MAKKLISINLDDDLIQEIDNVSKSVGMSRSAMVNLVMRGTMLGESNEVAKLLLNAALSVKNDQEKEADNAVKA